MGKPFHCSLEPWGLETLLEGAGIKGVLTASLLQSFLGLVRAQDKVQRYNQTVNGPSTVPVQATQPQLSIGLLCQHRLCVYSGPDPNDEQSPPLPVAPHSLEVSWAVCLLSTPGCISWGGSKHRLLSGDSGQVTLYHNPGTKEVFLSLTYVRWAGCYLVHLQLIAQLYVQGLEGHSHPMCRV